MFRDGSMTTADLGLWSEYPVRVYSDSCQMRCVFIIKYCSLVGSQIIPIDRSWEV